MSDRRRAARAAAAVTDGLPAHLMWKAADDPCWWDGNTRPHGLDRLMAHRRQREARLAYLAGLETRPPGVSNHEWAEAHRTNERN